MPEMKYERLYGTTANPTGSNGHPFPTGMPPTTTPKHKNASGELAEFLSGVVNGQIFNVPFGPALQNLTNLTQGLLPGSIMTICGDPGVGKAQPLSAKILTSRGWKTMGEISVGDLVGSSTGKFSRVTGVFPQGVKEAFRVTMSDGAVTECCNDHLWLTRTRRDRISGVDGTVKPLSDIQKTLAVDDGKRLNHCIPYCEPVRFSGTGKLPFNPYFLGLFLGDGCSRGSNVRLDNPEVDIRESFVRGLPEGDQAVESGTLLIRVRSHKRKTKSMTRQILSSLGLFGKMSHEKFVPSIYLHASVKNRLELLRGLLDTDGYVCDNGVNIEFTTSSPLLSENVKFLVGSLGGRCTTVQKGSSYKDKDGNKVSCRDSYRMNLSFNNKIVPVSSKKHLARWKGISRHMDRFIASVDSVGLKECQCISVDAPDHLYITDDFILTHNTFLILQMLRYWHSIGMDAVVYFVEEDRRFHIHRLLAQLEQRPDFIDLAWIKSMPNLVQEAMNRHTETLDDLGRSIWSETASRIDLVSMAGWIKSQASAGKRVLVVDPITAVSAGSNRWVADEDFMIGVKKTLVAHGASLILMTHGTKSNRQGPPTANDTAGGAAYNRFASCNVTIYKSKKPRQCRVQTKLAGEYTGTYGMFAAIHKTRNGKGSGLEVALTFGKELEFAEQGVVMEDVVEMNERNNDPFA